MNKVSLIIVNWNTTKRLDHMLSQLNPVNEIDIVVVDNNSSDKPHSLEKKYPHISFIFNKRSKGYAAACNQGALYAKGDWLFFLNSDLNITNDQVKECVDEIIEKNLVAASPVSSKEGYDKPIPSLFSLIVEFSPLNRVIPHPIFSKKTLFGGALLIKRTTFLELKGWDERFFVWFEDSDLTKRLVDKKARMGKLSVGIEHDGGGSFNNLSESDRFAYFFQSLYIYLKKHHSVFSQNIIKALTKRFWHGYVYPQMHDGASVVIPNMKRKILRNFLDHNKNNLDQIEEWIVVSSSLDFIEIWELRKQFPNVRFIPIEKNEGFAATVNIGMRVATGAFIGTCNGDVILNKESFAFMTSAPADAGSLNPIIKTSESNVESAGIQILVKGKALPQKDIPSVDYQKIDATNGACVIYTRKVLEKIGLFDERFGSYLEDIDIALRCTKAGYVNYVNKNSFILHLQHQTSKSIGVKKQWLDVKNWILLIIKHWTLHDILANLPSILLERLRNINGILKAI